MNVDRFVILLFTIQVMILTKDWSRIFFQCVIGLEVVDLVDRFIYNSTAFGFYDLIGIVVAFALPLLNKYRKPTKDTYEESNNCMAGD